MSSLEKGQGPSMGPGNSANVTCFGMVERIDPFSKGRLNDLQLWDPKVMLNHLVHNLKIRNGGTPWRLLTAGST